jgi:predicted  nucleic acid-binding Zn-ribbon protein
LNTFAKVFVVVLFALSLGLLVANASLFATRDNWKKKYDSSQSQIQGVQKQLSEEKDSHAADLKTKDQQVADLNSKLTQKQGDLERAQDEIKQKETQIEQINVKNQSLTTSVDQQTRNLDQLTKENQLNQDKIRELRTNLEAEQKERKQAVTEAAELESQNETSRAKVAQLQAEAKQLKDELQKWMAPAAFAAVPQKALDGFVKEMKDTYVVISLGSKDGVKESDTFDVYRGKDKYVGRVRVVQVAETFSLTREMSEYRQIQVREGDQVANYLGAPVQ